MVTFVNIIYFIGLLLWFIPTLSALQVAMQNLKDKDYVGGVIQIFMTICIITVYVVAILIFKKGIYNVL